LFSASKSASITCNHSVSQETTSIQRFLPSEDELFTRLYIKRIEIIIDESQIVKIVIRLLKGAITHRRKQHESPSSIMPTPPLTASPTQAASMRDPSPAPSTSTLSNVATSISSQNPHSLPSLYEPFIPHPCERFKSNPINPQVPAAPPTAIPTHLVPTAASGSRMHTTRYQRLYPSRPKAGHEQEDYARLLTAPLL